MKSDKFTAEAYKHLFESKHHYDKLSWQVAVFCFGIVSALIAYLPSVTADLYMAQVAKRFPIAAMSWLLLWGWFTIYERNRIWVEAANEAIRDFERNFRVRGAGVAFMEATLLKKVVLKNINELGKKVARPHTEILGAKSMHSVIRVVVWMVGVFALVAMFVP